MDMDISWYSEGQNNFRNEPSTSGTQSGRPPIEQREEKPDTKDIIEKAEFVCLVDDEDDPEEAVNSFHNLTRKNILLPFTGVEVQDEFKLLEAIRQFKMILEEKNEVLTLRKNLKELLFKYLLFFGANYSRVGLMYKEQYLDVMEDILIFYCDVIRKYFADQKRNNKAIKIIQETRRIKILLRDCLLKRMDRIMHVLLKVRMAPEIEKYGVLWGYVFVYFLTKFPHKHTDDDILRGFIAFQKFKTIRAKSEAAMIDKLMLITYKKTMEDLRKIPCLGEIMDRIKRDRFYTVRDMVTRYMRYYKEKRSRNETFDMEDCEEETDDSINNMHGFGPSSLSTSNGFANRRRRAGLDLASDYYGVSLFDDDVAQANNDVTTRLSSEDPVVILDDEEDDDDDVIVVSDVMKTVITIDDDDNDGSVEIQPTKSPPPIEIQSPDRVVQPSQSQTTTSSRQPTKSPLLVDLPSVDRVAQQSQSQTTTDTWQPTISPPPMDILATDRVVQPSQSQITTSTNSVPPRDETLDTPSPEDSMEVDLDLSSSVIPTESKNLVPEIISPSKEPAPKESTPINHTESVPKVVLAPQTRILSRKVKEVDNSLKITVVMPPSESTPKLTSSLEVVPSSELVDKSLLPPLESSEPPPDSSEKTQNDILPPNDSEALEYHKKPSLSSTVPEKVVKDSPSNKEVKLQINLDESSSQTSKTEKLLKPSDNITTDHSEAEKETSVKTVESDTLQLGTPHLDHSIMVLSPKITLDAHASSENVSPHSSSMETEESLTKNNISDVSESEKKLPSSTSSDVDCSGSKELSQKPHDKESESAIETKLSTDSIGKSSVVANSTTNVEIVRLIDKTTISPTLKDKPIGVLPSSKIPDDLDDTPMSEKSLNNSNTSDITSPSYESIDRNEVKILFLNGKLVDTGSSSSTTETDTSTSTTTSDSTAGSTSFDEYSDSTVNMSSKSISEAKTFGGDLDASLSDVPSEGNLEATVIQVQDFNENRVKSSQESTQLPVSESESLSSKINEYITSFVTEELSNEDITNLPIDLTASHENASDVIVVKCRPIEPLKEEENTNTAPAAEAVAFSTDEVLTSNEPIALLVTYPGSSQEESQHFLMCSTNLTLPEPFSSNKIAEPFSSNEIAPLNNFESEISHKLDSESVVLPPRRETTDSALSLSGSQPYTPQSSPSTRIEAVSCSEIGIGAVSPCSKVIEVPNHQTKTLHPPEPTTAASSHDHGIWGVQNLSQTLEKVSKNVNKVTKRRKSSEPSLKTSQSSKLRRKSSELPVNVALDLAQKTDLRNCDNFLRPAIVDHLPEDLSQSAPSAKGVTPQEVVKMSQMPFRYSQPQWSDTIQEDEVKQRATLSQKENYSNPQSSGKPQQEEIQTALLSHKEHYEIGNLSQLNTATSQQKSNISQQSHTSLPKQSVNPVGEQLNSLSKSASFVEKSPHNHYLKEYGSSLSLQHCKNIYDHSDLFNQAMEGPIGKPMVNRTNDENFLWESEIDAAKSKDDSFRDMTSGTISVKPDSLLYREQNESAILETPVKKGKLVSSLKSLRVKRDEKSSELKNPEKKKVTFSEQDEIKELPYPIFNKTLSVENEAVADQEQQPNLYDYSFNNYFTTNQRDNINIPLQPNLQSPEFGGPYYPNLYVDGTMNQSLLGQQPFPHQLSPQVLDRIEETVSTSSYQGFQPNPLPPKKRKLAEEISLKEISYPAQRQLCIADIQSDFPKVKTVAARKLYPEAAGYTDGQYYEYPDNFDYSNKRSVMNVYINGVREGSGNYPVCLMIGTVHTCPMNQSQETQEDAGQQGRPSEGPPPNFPVPHVENPAQQQEVVKAKRAKRHGNGDAPPAKRGRGRPRKNV